LHPFHAAARKAQAAVVEFAGPWESIAEWNAARLREACYAGAIATRLRRDWSG